MRHKSFNSIYGENYEVVEEQRRNQRLYPHTEQLPFISRAINLEFLGALPGRIARTDHRAEPQRKVLLQIAARLFCNYVNSNREDEVRLLPAYTPDLVAKVAVLQHIAASERLGVRHTFRFFTGDDFLPDVHLSGKRIAFATHVLDRFSSRVPHSLAAHVVELFYTMLCYPALVARVGKGDALVFEYEDSIIALTFIERDGEYFFTTCLTPNEMDSLHFESPPRQMYFHYGSAFTEPTDRNLATEEYVQRYSDCWKTKKPFTVPPVGKKRDPVKAWRKLAGYIDDIANSNGRTEHTCLEFLDGLYGPVIVFLDDLPEEAPSTLPVESRMRH
jgi:hypothetical protein